MTVKRKPPIHLYRSPNTWRHAAVAVLVFSATLIISLAISFAVVLLLVMAARAATSCRDEKGPEPGYWSWRLIDGRKCWYAGRVVKDKNELVWPSGPNMSLDAPPVEPNVIEVPIRVLTEREANYATGLEMLRRKFVDPDERSMMRQW